MRTGTDWNGHFLRLRLRASIFRAFNIRTYAARGRFEGLGEGRAMHARHQRHISFLEYILVRLRMVCLSWMDECRCRRYSTAVPGRDRIVFARRDDETLRPHAAGRRLLRNKKRPGQQGIRQAHSPCCRSRSAPFLRMRPRTHRAGRSPASVLGICPDPCGRLPAAARSGRVDWKTYRQALRR